MPGRGQGGLFKVLGTGVGAAAEYREHRKQQKLSRENSRQDTDAATAGPSSRPNAGDRSSSSVSNLPPSYEAVVQDGGDRSLSTGAPATDDKKGARGQYEDDYDSSSDSSSSPDYAELEGDEAVWDLDEAVERERGGSTSPPESPGETTSDANALALEVISLKRAALAAAPGFEQSPLPCPVIIPQRRPRKKIRGFVRAYAPLLGECSGISQETFLTFLKNFHSASKASPYFTYIQIAAGIAGLAPSVIAMAVTTAVQVAAGAAKEVQTRQRTNNFLARMNEEVFQPAGLFAMVVKYKTQAEAEASGNSILARFGVGTEKVDLSTNQTIAKYMRTTSSDAAEGSRSMSQRMQNLRLASGTTKGAFELPESAPLIFPEIDKAVALEGEETFKAKAKDAKGFLVDYLDRRAQVKYAAADPNSMLNLPDEQRTFRSKLADPNHPMYNGGLVGFVSGGALTQNRSRQQYDRYDRDQRRRSYNDDRSRDKGDYKSERRELKREHKDDRRLQKYERRLDSGRGLTAKKERRYDAILGRREGNEGRGRGQGPIGMLVGAAMGAAGSRGADRTSQAYEDGYNSRPTSYNGRERSFDDRELSYGRSAPQSYGSHDSRGPAPFGSQASTSYGAAPPAPAPYGGQTSTSYGPTPPAPYGGYNAAAGNDRLQPPGAANSGAQYNGRGRRQKQNGGSMVKKLMTEDVLYLMIVNLPSEEELAAARKTLAKAQ